MRGRQGVMVQPLPYRNQEFGFGMCLTAMWMFTIDVWMGGQIKCNKRVLEFGQEIIHLGVISIYMLNKKQETTRSTRNKMKRR